VYYLSGTGISTIDEVDFHYTPGTFCIIPPKSYHSEIATTETEILYSGFNYDNSLGPIKACLLKDSDKGIVLSYMKRIKKEMKQQRKYYDYSISLSIKFLVVEILRMLAPSVTSKLPSIISFEYIINYLNSNYAKEVDLKFLANSINYSYDRFRHKFKDYYGISPLQYLINIRISQAKILLQISDRSIDEIAKLCGIKKSSQFITTFKNETGITPANYRRNSKKYKEVAVFVSENEDIKVTGD
jgi:AraC family transcriptional activator of pobA